ncbi:phage replisome organizer N-terminal domain-containing protein [Clostridium beijerinckii]|uniref:Phage replisome organizer n=1 Tax=Clostridium beijerinckii TaxID=1520 RepID=A0AAW3WFA6_CLOBE|nr:phage replisome organizer N-terminal domain-containing protein [Clostridium beijerinckii]MBC2460352.1 phage replisome organizer [Clostridium beijerinckii]MBC2477574.1 phage replisome organizer [Clostridium beijerinckii]NOV59795.1 putative phage replisome organizer [Clostridium beijerinckii]NOV71421.1 putative phage replisome organizer [Clostridium beijerinckii]NOW34348.1 putative phage replisome organizer [Clostridium beijerinckii]
MADIKWIKLATCMPDDEKMKLIDAMKERDTIHYVWIRILLLGGKLNANGEIFLSEGKPLTSKMLAILFSRPLEAIKLALRVLSKFGMIEIAPDKVIRIVNWDKYQNIEGMEKVREQNRKRAETHREKKKWEKKAGKSDAQEGYEGEVLEESITFNENEELEETNDLEQKKNSSEGNYSPEENKALDENATLENLETSEEASTNTDTDEAASDISSEIANNNEDISNSIIETADNNCIVTKNISNVTQNKNNVTVTQQNKKEIENKKKNKKEKKEIDKDRNTESKKNTCDLNNKSSTCDEDVSQSSLFEQHNNTKSESVEEDDINLKAIELMQYHEKITGKPGGCDYVALRSAIDLYGEKWVKKAMDVGFQKNCPDINYAIGVLKNWKRDGCPEDNVEVKKNGFRGTRKSNTADKNEFAGFKPKEPRKLTEAERKRIEANLI